MSFYYYFSFLRVLSIRQNILIQANESNRFHLFLLILFLFLLLFYFLMYARAIRKNLISSSPNNTKLRGAFTMKSQKHKTKIVFYGTEMDERAFSAINYFRCVCGIYVMATQYDLTLVASDSLNENYTRIIITVRDVNDLPPTFPEKNYSKVMDEEIPAPFPMIQVQKICYNINKLGLL